ncbi:unnamed protein product [Paramecium pentaurelia]|uniref:Uncharacterized protein n=1 Tax=Paramecium pentaurelia TaxID=43138 RepID=A0A8S1XRA4_9CILI|nr:unnamed protein product [Paramecium pentaurelia]
MAVCFNPDGNILASGRFDNSILLWDVKTRQQKALLNVHALPSQSVCFSSDGNTLASGSRDSSIRLWDVKTGQEKAELDGHKIWVMAVCFSPDGNTLASGSDDNSIRLWDVKTGQEIKSIDKNYKDFLIQFNIPLYYICPILEDQNYITTLLLSQSAIFQAKGALVFKGEFINHQGIDLRSLLKYKGSWILQNQLESNQK